MLPSVDLASDPTGLSDPMRLLTLCLELHSQYVALKIGRVEIIRPFSSVAYSTSHLHFILRDAVPVLVGGYRTQVVWMKSPV